MPARQPSPLRAPDPAGSFLFSDDVIREITNEEERFGLYTGDRCPAEKRDAIIQLVAEGRAPHDIGRLLHVDRRTVLNVADRFAVEIADYERRMPAKLRRCKFAIANRIEREAGSLPAQSLAITLKMISDIEALDSGRASARVEHVHRVDLFSDFGEFVRNLESAEVLPEKNEPRNPFSAPGNFLMDASAAADADADRGNDAQSHVCEPFTQENATHLPTYLPTLDADQAPIAAGETPAADARAPGGGGMPREAGAGHAAKGKPSQKFSANGDSLL